MKSKNPVIFIVCGKARSGKSTAASIIREYYQKKNKKTVNLMYSEPLKNYVKKISNWDGNERTKPRTLLQQLGTDYIRREVSIDFFVKRMIEDLNIYDKYFDIITISDARFPNEIDGPKKKYEVITIKINTKRINNELTESEKKHSSECSLEEYNDYQYVIDNDGTIEELKNKIEKILEEVKV